MNKKIVKILIACGCLIVVIGAIYYKVSSDNPYNQFNNITAKEALSEDQKDYYVYYYMKDCYYCNLIKDEVFEYANNNDNIYFVDLKKYNSDRESYDWETFNTENDIEIGTSSDGKTIEYYEGESEAKYLENLEVNKYGKIKQFEIKIADQDYLNTNKNAELGKVYATQLIPEIDYSQYKAGDKMVIAGAPTLLHIKNGKIDGFYFDSRDIGEFLSGVNDK